MIREAIILAGGLGTRLKSAVPDLPKCLAPVGGKPFLEYLLRHGKNQGIQRFIFALGYRTGQVEAFVRAVLAEDEYVFSIENTPLGTGGAIFQAAALVEEKHVLVMNADTFFGVSLPQLSAFHRERSSLCTLSLKPMQDVDRYGAVDMDDDQVVTGFREKQHMDNGLINGGVYALQVRPFLSCHFPAVFSFEKDFLEKECAGGRIYGMVSREYFIDIGIPEDYLRAQTELIQQWH